MTDISLHEMFTTIEAILHGEFVPEDRICSMPACSAMVWKWPAPWRLMT